jgi:thiosulfate/3-mercaptopyruvate sulfurtransferase
MFRVALALAALAVAAETPRFEMLVSTANLARQLTDPGVIILHVSDRESSFTDGHIPGARFVRHGDIAVDGGRGLGSELPPVVQLKRIFEAVGVSDSSRVFIYGSSTVAAARAFFTLDAAGHARVALVDGGLARWRAEGRPLETGASKPAARGAFTPRINAARIAEAQFIQQQLGANGIALLDIRPDAEYLGTDGGMGGMHTPGHIAGAQQLPWNTLVGADGRFLPLAQLEAKLAAAGAVSSKPVVAYCMVGMRASVAYFVARYLGYPRAPVRWLDRRLVSAQAAHENRKVLMIGALLISALFVVEQTQATPPQKPCSQPEYRQFDFWVGDWDVRTADGKPAGRNRIDIVEGGCGLQENWTGLGNTGRSINSYWPGDRKWHQVWLGSGGLLMHLSGQFQGDTLTLEGAVQTAKGTRVLQRLAFTKRSDGTVRQHWQQSQDDGKTWQTVFDGIYTRRKKTED